MRRALGLGAVAAFVAVFLLTRLVNLRLFPVFLDEAIHVDWALKVAQTGRYLGVTDGGRYLPIWLYSLVAPRFADPLLAVRLCSALFGLMAALGLIWLGRVLYTTRAGFVAALLYLVLPSALLYDRMALVDSLITALVVFSLGCAARWASTASLAWAATLGVAIGCAAITKLYGALLLSLPLLSLWLWPGQPRRTLWAQLQWVHAFALAVMLPVFLELPATLQFVSENVWVFRSGAQGAAHLLKNLGLALYWPLEYLTPLGFALVCLAVVHARRAPRPADRVLLALAAFWGLFFVVTGGQDWFPRYLLPVLVPLLLLPAHHALQLSEDLAERVGRRDVVSLVPWALVGLFALSSYRLDRALLTAPVEAPLLGIDRWQYLEDWPSGSRLDDVAAFLKHLASQQGSTVVTRDLRSGPLLEGLNLLMRRERVGIEFVDIDIRKQGLVGGTRRLLAEKRPVVLSVEHALASGLLLSLDGRALARPLALFVKPGRHRQIDVYCVHGPCTAPEDALADPRSLDGTEPGLPASGPPPAGTGLDRPGALEEARVCGLELGERSLRACRRAVELGLSWPRAAEVQYSLGRNLTTLGRFKEAAQAFRESLRLMPDDVETTLAYAEALEVLDRHAEALALSRDALRFASDAAAVHHRLGWNLARLGRLGEAEAALRQAVALDAAAAGPHNDLAVVLWLKGQRDDALKEAREAIRLDGESVFPRYNLGIGQAALAAGR